MNTNHEPLIILCAVIVFAIKSTCGLSGNQLVYGCLLQEKGRPAGNRFHSKLFGGASQECELCRYQTLYRTLHVHQAKKCMA